MKWYWINNNFLKKYLSATGESIGASGWGVGSLTEQ